MVKLRKRSGPYNLRLAGLQVVKVSLGCANG